MRKAALLLTFTALAAGCTNTGPGSPGDPYASIRCSKSLDPPPIPIEHVEYVRAQSDDGDLYCKNVLALMYESGTGVPQDIPKAKALFQSIADVDEAGYHNLGRMAEQGIGETPDYAKARALYQRSISVSDSKRKLAKFMEEGIGGPQDLNGAMALYLEVSSEDMYRLRAKGVPLSPEQINDFNAGWLKGVTSRIQMKTGQVKNSLPLEVTRGPALKPVWFALKYIKGSLVPEIDLLESSGNNIVDHLVLKGMSSYRFRYEPIMPEGKTVWPLVTSLSPNSAPRSLE
ncbi:sel1 repeat family protein [Pseudomonas hygromyciniae]|uniref:Sel1 repeat family protein n=1 Tax=Pseudomonas hygromyciniae TaxID=2812000 RepID=A0ABX7JXH3_9PSED|nr:SEL1-like repeat protein [Pseudomonas hygromyciniae]MBN0979089.1 sel1 repeat family protein [Pseudomonas hygromyciniae]QSB40081.1 sel1 repeat family protein [Pseudomonas hygromyciniae]